MEVRSAGLILVIHFQLLTQRIFMRTFALYYDDTRILTPSFAGPHDLVHDFVRPTVIASTVHGEI